MKQKEEVARQETDRVEPTGARSSLQHLTLLAPTPQSSGNFASAFRHHYMHFDWQMLAARRAEQTSPDEHPSIFPSLSAPLQQRPASRIPGGSRCIWL